MITCLQLDALLQVGQERLWTPDECRAVAEHYSNCPGCAETRARAAAKETEKALAAAVKSAWCRLGDALPAVLDVTELVHGAALMNAAASHSAELQCCAGELLGIYRRLLSVRDRLLKLRPGDTTGGL